MKRKREDEKKLISASCFVKVFNIQEMLYGCMIYNKMNIYKLSKRLEVLTCLKGLRSEFIQRPEVS